RSSTAAGDAASSAIANCICSGDALPPPLRGRGGEGGSSGTSLSCQHPSPCPSPSRGREPTEFGGPARWSIPPLDIVPHPLAQRRHVDLLYAAAAGEVEGVRRR